MESASQEALFSCPALAGDHTALWRGLNMRNGVRCGAWTAALVLACAQSQAHPAKAAQARTAVLSAFEPEWQALVQDLAGARTEKLGGMKVATGTLQGRPVVLMMSGVSMVNAAMNTQALLDRYTVDRIVFSGIAGGLDPALNIGDVVVPEKWVSSLDVAMGREVDGRFERPAYYKARAALAPYGMMFPIGVRAGRDYETGEVHMEFPVDPAMFSLAQSLVKRLTLKNCTVDQACLTQTPKVVVGGAGVSSTAFVDNAEYRAYLQQTFGARAADMESAAVGQVAYANGVPYIVFRSLSDLAGGGEKGNEMGTFMRLAAENSASVVKAFLKALPPIARLQRIKALP
jgi:adenosylhomocysteine nucleosidase